MSNQEIQSILKEALEEEIPSSQVNLWPAVEADLLAGKYIQNQQGESMITVKPHRMPRLALAIALFLALLALFFATPQGRSFAQSVLEYFTRSEGRTFPVEESLIAPLTPDETSPTAPPPAPLISAAEAEAQVGFEVAELPETPEGFEYLGARLYGNHVSIEYRTPGYGHLIIKQSLEGYNQSEWGSVPGEVVIPVKIGDIDGEFSQGTFVVYPGETNATWNPEATIVRLRWVNEGVWFEIALYGEAVEFFDMEGLIRLAESLNNQQ